MTYYKILHLPSAAYLQSLVNKKLRREGTCDTVFSSREEAHEGLRIKLVYETEVLDIDNAVFPFFEYDIEEFEGDPPENPIIYNRKAPEEVHRMTVGELVGSWRIKSEDMI